MPVCITRYQNHWKNLVKEHRTNPFKQLKSNSQSSCFEHIHLEGLKLLATSFLQILTKRELNL